MNILSLIQNQLTPETVGQISNAVGENPEATRSALGTVFPALLGTLVAKANTAPSGVTDLFNILKQGQSQGGWSDAISSAITGLGRAPHATNQSFLSSFLGSRLGPVVDFIASRCGIRNSSASSLLGMAAPLLMGTLSKQVSSQGLGPAGLGQLLSSQTQYLKDSLPSGLANILGIGNLLSNTPSPEADAPKPELAESAYSESYVSTREREPARSSGILKWAWVPLLVALFGWVAINRMHRMPEAGGTSETGGNTVATGRAVSPKFANLNLTPGGVADRLARAISAGNWNKTFELQGFTTDNTGALTDSAKSSIREIGMLLSAAPEVKLRVIGHGDTDEAGLSRANAIKSALISVGVAEERISTRGETGAGAPTINLVR